MDISISNIENSIQDYLNEEQSDYAIMLSGEWGAGKTYFVKDEVFRLIKGSKKREVYVSLIGVNSDEEIERKVFEKINPFYNQEKSKAANESDHLEFLVHKTEPKSRNYIPKNVVLIFDDLERIDESYFESAMGFINVYIEHYHTKCIFVCNEQKLEEKIALFKKIKEKYIRFTYNFKADFEQLLIKELVAIESTQNIKIDEVLHVFNKGRCYNLRTLFFALSIFKRIINGLEKERIHFDEHNDQLFQLMLNYICFYSIEHKSKGVSHKILNQITIAYASGTFFDVDLNDSKQYLNEFEENQESVEIAEDKDKETSEIERIQKQYFSKDAINFQYFESIAEYIAYGFLDIEKLKLDINNAIDILNNELEKKRKQQITNIFSLKNEEYVEVIKTLLKSAEEGELDLISYVLFFHKLGWLDLYKLEGVEDYPKTTSKLHSGINLAYDNNKLVYVSNLENQIHVFHESDQYDKEFNKFRDLVISINDKLEESQVSYEVDSLLKYIKDENKTNLYEVLSNKETLKLNSSSAKKINSILKESDTDIVEVFSDALHRRYIERIGSIFSPTRENEMEFIRKFYQLLNSNDTLKLGSLQKMSNVQLYLLKNMLSKYIEDENKKKQ